MPAPRVRLHVGSAHPASEEMPPVRAMAQGAITMNDAKLEPDYVYQQDPPEVEEMQCPEEQYLSCAEWMNKTEMLAHYISVHPEYIAMDHDAMDVIFEQERNRRYPR